MRKLYWMLLAIMMGALDGQAQTPAGGGTGTVAQVIVPTPPGEGFLTARDVEAFRTEFTDPKTGQKIVFDAAFCVDKPRTAEARAKVAASGKIPIRINCSLRALKEVGGRTVAKNLSGVVNICIMDSAGKVLDAPKSDLDKMCTA